MFARRPDAKLVTELSNMRRIMPHISPRRNDSAFYLPQDIEVEAAFAMLDRLNRERPPERPISLFHLFLRSAALAVELHPGVNRFVKGGRLWQREGVYLTFSAKRELSTHGGMTTIKRRFEVDETLEEMVDAVYDLLNPAREGRESTSEKETNLLVRLPNFATGALIRAANLLDYFGLLPRSVIDPDPLYTSLFIANLGSVGLGAGFHHLWERGTCSLFGVMGHLRAGDNGRRLITACWTYDERIEDGLYAYHGLAGIQERLENPELLLLPSSELNKRVTEGGKGAPAGQGPRAA